MYVLYCAYDEAAVHDCSQAVCHVGYGRCHVLLEGRRRTGSGKGVVEGVRVSWRGKGVMEG